MSLTISASGSAPAVSSVSLSARQKEKTAETAPKNSQPVKTTRPADTGSVSNMLDAYYKKLFASAGSASRSSPAGQVPAAGTASAAVSGTAASGNSVSGSAAVSSPADRHYTASGTATTTVSDLVSSIFTATV